MSPKVLSREKVSQFIPISLCNVVYKVIAKMTTMRLKLFLPEIISPTQSAFSPGRLITDNALIAYESYNSAKENMQGWVVLGQA